MSDPDNPYKPRRVMHASRRLALMFFKALLVGACMPVLGAAQSQADVAPSALFKQDSLPMAGLFIGNPSAGLQTGNNSIAYEHSRRFRAERTGQVEAVRYQNRLLDDQSISNRCRRTAPESDWCQCVRHKLDGSTCGYSLGSSYHVGNGGRIVVELRPDDGTEAHLPAATVLGRTRTPFVPAENSDQQQPVLEFADPVRLEAGKIYHLVYRNLNPPDGCELSRVPPEQAGDCPRDQGAISLNGMWLGHQAPSTGASTGQWGPFLGDVARNFYRRPRDSQWFPSMLTKSWYELRYDDGLWVGDMYISGWQQRDSGLQTVGGHTVARQQFTMRQASIEVNGLWLSFGHAESTSPDGKPLKAELKSDTGTVLARGFVPPSPECQQLARSSDWVEQQCRAWGYATFERPVLLQPGQRYWLEFRATPGSEFVLPTYFPMHRAERTNWKQSRAEISVDNGAHWQPWAGPYYPERDLALLLTTTGNPIALD